MQLRASGGAFGELVRVFSLLAIVTSTVGFVYGLVDFFADIIDTRLAKDDARLAAAAATGGGDAVPTADGEGGATTAASPLAPGSALRQVALFGLVFLPPLVVAESDPSLFFTALDYAGVYPYP